MLQFLFFLILQLNDLEYFACSACLKYNQCDIWHSRRKLVQYIRNSNHYIYWRDLNF
jgi:hypothetical protein